MPIVSAANLSTGPKLRNYILNSFAYMKLILQACRCDTLKSLKLRQSLSCEEILFWWHWKFVSLKECSIFLAPFYRLGCTCRWYDGNFSSSCVCKCLSKFLVEILEISILPQKILKNIFLSSRYPILTWSFKAWGSIYWCSSLSWGFMEEWWIDLVISFVFSKH